VPFVGLFERRDNENKITTKKFIFNHLFQRGFIISPFINLKKHNFFYDFTILVLSKKEIVAAYLCRYQGNRSAQQKNSKQVNFNHFM